MIVHITCCACCMQGTATALQQVAFEMWRHHILWMFCEQSTLERAYPHAYIFHAVYMLLSIVGRVTLVPHYNEDVVSIYTQTDISFVRHKMHLFVSRLIAITAIKIVFHVILLRLSWLTSCCSVMSFSYRLALLCHSHVSMMSAWYFIFRVSVRLPGPYRLSQDLIQPAGIPDTYNWLYSLIN